MRITSHNYLRHAVTIEGWLRLQALLLSDWLEFWLFSVFDSKLKVGPQIVAKLVEALILLELRVLGAGQPLQ